MKKRPSGGFAGGCFTIFSDCRGQGPRAYGGMGRFHRCGGAGEGGACCLADIGGVELCRLPGGKGFLFDAGGGVHLALSLLLRRGERGFRLPWNRRSRCPPVCLVVRLSGYPARLERTAGPFRRRIKSGERTIRPRFFTIKEDGENQSNRDSMHLSHPSGEYIQRSICPWVRK